MAAIATYVFIDLETTSLPQLELNRTKITELSMVVMKRRHVLDCRPGATPRVQHKLTLCFNPRRLIDPECTKTTGLCNDILEHESDFNMTVFNTINSFLACFEKPVCLIAQNGHTFDFPILKNHFEKLKVQLPEDIMCADSLHAFYDLWKHEKTAPLCNTPSMGSLNTPVPDNETENVKILNKNNSISMIEQSSEDIDKILSEIDMEDINKTQIDNNDQVDKSEFSNYQLLMQAQNENTPKRKPQLQNKNIKKSLKRKLFYEGDPKPKISFKLKDLYERVLNRPGIESHRAENDCIMTAELAACKADKFVKWIDDNNCSFADVKPMTLGVPLGC